MKKKNPTGRIPLCGKTIRAELVRKNKGGPVVKLLEPMGAYAVGDEVQCGTGEFVADGANS